ncbi:MAG: cyclic pyranopterin monophosphate synthase MoaC [Dehalococcoidia bacterium]|nr:cyclic pyranopterin monophosphate synthase MoaC [Dehalococcoidia bacterium]
MIHIYTDGACQGNPGPGGWAAILHTEDGGKTVLQGGERSTTNNRMEVTAAIKGLEVVQPGAPVQVHTDSQYLVNTMTKGWKRQANKDLWKKLDSVVADRNISWEWIRGHNGHVLNEEADSVAVSQAAAYSKVNSSQEDSAIQTSFTLPGASQHSLTRNVNYMTPVGNSNQSHKLSHIDEQGKAQMVDVSEKQSTMREATARGRITMEKTTLDAIRGGRIEKGDVITVARIAGIMAAKKTAELIPMCHPLAITHISVEIDFAESPPSLNISSTVRTTDKTGVEMEALTAVSVAALTVYDMCKAIDRRMIVGEIHLARKSGGKSGTFTAK